MVFNVVSRSYRGVAQLLVFLVVQLFSKQLIAATMFVQQSLLHDGVDVNFRQLNQRIKTIFVRYGKSRKTEDSKEKMSNSPYNYLIGIIEGLCSRFSPVGHFGWAFASVNVGKSLDETESLTKTFLRVLPNTARWRHSVRKRVVGSSAYLREDVPMQLGDPLRVLLADLQCDDLDLLRLLRVESRRQSLAFDALAGVARGERRIDVVVTTGLEEARRQLRATRGSVTAAGRTRQGDGTDASRRRDGRVTATGRTRHGDGTDASGRWDGRVRATGQTHQGDVTDASG